MTDETAPVAGKATAFGTLVNIITSPAKAMKDIEDRNKWLWLPLILLLVLSMVSTSMYFSSIDMEWFVDQIIAGSPQEIPDEARQIMSSTMMIGALVGTLIMIPLMSLIYAVYLLLVDKFSSARGHDFGDWFSIVVWGSFPNVLAAIAAIAYLLIAGHSQMTPDELNFYTLNALVTQYPMGHPAQGWAQAISPFLFWSLYITGVGVSQRTGRSIGKSVVIAAAPFVIVYGIWGASVLGG